MLLVKAATALAAVQETIQTVQEKSLGEKAQDYLITYGVPLLKAILIFLIGKWIARMVVNLLRKIMTKQNVDKTLIGFLCNIAYMALLVMVIISALQTMGMETTSFVAVLGAATLAIGFALQGSLSNFAAGVMLIIFRPFKAGDYVEAGGTAGIVEEVGVFATGFRTPDNKKVIVPNGSITDGNIVNYSAKDTRRVDMVFGIGYGDDIKKAKDILQRILEADERVLKDPAPTIGVSELADSSVNIVCRPWAKTADYWPLFFDVHEAVKNQFDANDVTIPFPQRDVHMHEVGAA